MANDGGSTRSVLIGFAIGAAMGAAAGLLLAPASGLHTRRKLARKARDLRETGETIVDESGKFPRRQRDRVAAVVEDL